MVDVSLTKDLESEKSVFKFYQKVIELKKEDVATYGIFKEYDHNNKKVIAYSRELNNKGLFVFGNFSSKEVEWEIPQDIFAKKKEVILSNYNVDLNTNKVKLRPYEAVVFKY